jgi:hypothetical protein
LIPISVNKMEDGFWGTHKNKVDGCIVVKHKHRYTRFMSNLSPDLGNDTLRHPLSVRVLCRDKGVREFGTVEEAYQFLKFSTFETVLNIPGLAFSKMFTSGIGGVDAKKRAGKGQFVSRTHVFFGTKAEAGRVYDRGMVEWKKISMNVMKMLLMRKFSSSNPDYATALMNTAGDDIYEQRSRGKSVWTQQPDGSPGLLGELLMERRAILIKERDGCGVSNKRLASGGEVDAKRPKVV